MQARKTRRRIAGTALIGTMLLVGATVPAGAAVAVAGPGSQAMGFAPPVVVAPVGGPLTFVNVDPGAPHNLIADGVYGPKTQSWCTPQQKTTNRCPLFWSATIFTGQTPVLGLENAESGETYPFVCTVHVGMKGTLLTV